MSRFCGVTSNFTTAIIRGPFSIVQQYCEMRKGLTNARQKNFHNRTVFVQLHLFAIVVGRNCSVFILIAQKLEFLQRKHIGNHLHIFFLLPLQNFSNFLFGMKVSTVELQYNVLAPSAAKRLVYWSWPLFLDHYFLTQDDLCMYFYIYTTIIQQLCSTQSH